MATIEPPTRYKPEDLLKMPDGDRYELVNGRLVEKEMGWEASEIASQLFLLLGSFVRDHQLGRIVVEGSYQCFADAPDKVRKPDVSFIRRDRMPANERPKGHNPIVPDLVVEVVLLHDLFSEVEVKVEEYLRAGVSLVWVVSPETRTVNVYRLEEPTSSRLHAGDDLTGEDIVPGFHCRVRQIFEPEAQR
jgi:Uma2 family endonuclease